MRRRTLALALVVLSFSSAAQAQSASDELPSTRDDIELPSTRDDGVQWPNTDADLALAQASVGQLMEARATCARALAANALDEPALVTRCETLIAELDARIPVLVVNVRGLPAGTPVAVFVDGEPLDVALLGRARRSNPGAHVVTALAFGHRPARQEIRLRDGEGETVTLQPTLAHPLVTERRAPDTVATMPAYGVLGLGVAGAGLIAFSVGAIVATKAVGDATARCAGYGCAGDDVAGDLDRAKLYANVANVGALAALAGGGVGLYALLSRPKVDSARAVSPYVAAGGAGVSGKF